MAPTIKAYGEWKSPITADFLLEFSSGHSGYSDITVDPTTNTVFYAKTLTTEKGRGAIFARRLGSTREQALTPSPFNCRTRVHEYGGGSFIVYKNVLYFSNDEDFRIYKIDLTDTEAIHPVTHDSKKRYRYADFAAHPSGQFLVAVREDHNPLDCEPYQVVNTLVSIRLSDGNESILVEGADFYAAPRFSPTSPFTLAFVSWMFPNMPWDFTHLDLANVEISSDHHLIVTSTTNVAGYDFEESVMEPEWASNGKLFFISDRTGWWNLYKYTDSGDAEHVLAKPVAHEFGGPAWTFNTPHYTPLTSDPSKIVATYIVDGNSRLTLISVTERTYTDISTHFTVIRNIRSVGDTLIFTGASPTQSDTLVSLNLLTGSVSTLSASAALPLPNGIISIPEPITFPTTDDKVAYAYFYPPTNSDFIGPDNELPPLKVLSHGGPTAACTSAFSIQILYWTSRGFAVADVNYGGSTGYGTEYRRRLNKNWGIVDVDDCCNIVKYLADKGKINAEKACIKGGSAGGYTTLACLAFRDVFKIGCSLYGVSDITLLAKDTHKFESRYGDILIGPYPEAEKTYYDRSPINFANQMSCPCIFFQGLEDKVVPPSQSEKMVEALKEKGLPVAYVTYEGEGHGFRQAENIKRTVEVELWFYGKLWNFEPADNIKGVEIINWPPQK